MSKKSSTKDLRGSGVRSTLLSAAILALLSAEAGASCLPSEPAPTYLGYWEVPYNLTTTNTATNVVSYSSGHLVAESPYTWSASNPQLFSDREYDAPNTCKPNTFASCVLQPFSAVAPDELGVAVYNYGAWGISVKFTLESWGNGFVFLPGTCDSVTGVLYGSGSWAPNSDNVFYTLALGPPEFKNTFAW